MTFRVGQKVVCIIDAGFDKYFGDEIPPVKGEIYTIRAIHTRATDRIGLLLCEIDNSHMTERWGWGVEPGFLSTCFRPVVERKTDISIFTAMLKPSKVEA